MRHPLRAEIRFAARSDAAADADAALDLLAEALADRLVAEARAEVAQQRGVPEDTLDREHRRVTSEARTQGVLAHVGGGAEP